MQKTYNLLKWKPNPTTALEHLVESILCGNTPPEKIIEYIDRTLSNRLERLGGSQLGHFDRYKLIKEIGSNVLKEIKTYAVQTGDLSTSNPMYKALAIDACGNLGRAAAGAAVRSIGFTTVSQAASKAAGSLVSSVGLAIESTTVSGAVSTFLGPLGRAPLVSLGPSGALVGGLAMTALSHMENGRSVQLSNIFTLVQEHIHRLTSQCLVSMSESISRDTEKISDLERENRELKERQRLLETQNRNISTACAVLEERSQEMGRRNEALEAENREIRGRSGVIEGRLEMLTDLLRSGRINSFRENVSEERRTPSRLSYCTVL